MRCFLFGHQDSTESILPDLRREVQKHITENGVTEFIVGRYGNFDYLARRTVHQAKAMYPHIRLTLLLPYYPPQLPIPQEFDGTCYPEGLETVPPRFRIPRANRAMLDRCEFAIACVATRASSSGELLEQARRRERLGQLCVTNILELKNGG